MHRRLFLLLLRLVLLLCHRHSAVSSSSSPQLDPCSAASPPCPPFLSPPPFPFSFSPGCGHPSFLLRCSSSNHSLLTISSTPLPILPLPRHPPHSLLLLLPRPLPLNLSHSPFRLTGPLHRHRHNTTSVLLTWNPSSDPFFSLCSSCSGSCGYNTSHRFLCFQTHRHHRHSHHLLFLILIVPIFLASVLLLLVLRRRGDPPPPPLRLTHHPPSFTYERLLASTQNFSPARNLGHGGFGSVYLAFLDDGVPAAVKRLHGSHLTSSFANEIAILSSIDHPNLIRLRGYCCDPRGLLLVYDYVPNGTLAGHLHGGGAPLPWAVRVAIAAQVASAMEYLHFSVRPPVVHRDITSANVFVEGDMRARVGDFGLSRMLAGAGETVRTGPQGTPGYLDPDYHRFFRLTEKSDVYSFGVVLLELITGLKAVDPRRGGREVGLADMVVARIQLGELHGVVDPGVVREVGVMQTVGAVAELAFRCLAADKDDRPDSREVARELSRIRRQVEGGGDDPG